MDITVVNLVECRRLEKEKKEKIFSKIKEVFGASEVISCDYNYFSREGTAYFKERKEGKYGDTYVGLYCRIWGSETEDFCVKTFGLDEDKARELADYIGKLENKNHVTLYVEDKS